MKHILLITLVIYSLLYSGNSTHQNIGNTLKQSTLSISHLVQDKLFHPHHHAKAKPLHSFASIRNEVKLSASREHSKDGEDCPDLSYPISISFNIFGGILGIDRFYLGYPVMGGIKLAGGLLLISSLYYVSRASRSKYKATRFLSETQIRNEDGPFIFYCLFIYLYVILVFAWIAFLLTDTILLLSGNLMPSGGCTF